MNAHPLPQACLHVLWVPTCQGAHIRMYPKQEINPYHPSIPVLNCTPHIRTYVSTHPYPTPKKPKHSTHPSVRIHTSYRIKHRQNRIAHPSVSTHPYPTSDRITHRQNQDILADRPYTMHACISPTIHTLILFPSASRGCISKLSIE